MRRSWTTIIIFAWADIKRYRPRLHRLSWYRRQMFIMSSFGAFASDVYSYAIIDNVAPIANKIIPFYCFVLICLGGWMVNRRDERTQRSDFEFRVLQTQLSHRTMSKKSPWSLPDFEFSRLKSWSRSWSWTSESWYWSWNLRVLVLVLDKQLLNPSLEPAVAERSCLSCHWALWRLHHQNRLSMTRNNQSINQFIYLHSNQNVVTQ